MSLVSPLDLGVSDPHGRLVSPLHPQLISKGLQLLTAMAAVGLPMLVTDAVRTVAEQQALYAKGRTAPGAIVTEDDGVTHVSNHQLHADGFGHAIDCTFVVNGEPSWLSTLPWSFYGSVAEQLGLKWGGRWSAIKDLPHVELP